MNILPIIVALSLGQPKAPEGFRVDLWAQDPMLGNTVAFCIDEKGRLFTAESYRFNRGTEEYRHRPFFLEGDLKNSKVEERLAMYRHFQDKFPGGMDFFTKYTEKIRILEDTTGGKKGVANMSATWASAFNDPLDGLAAGILAHDGDIYFTCIPNLWRFRNGEKKALLTGFGVQTAFLGHDLHGLIVGPDGKMYFTIGDRGYNVTSLEGKTFSGPRQGAVFRCDLDGKNFEVVHTGLRNPQELAFDQFGNLFADDNNCDKGDHSRLVYVVEGGHSGWNMAYQTIEPPYLTGPWHAEKLWHLQHEGQAAYIVPPIGKLGAGPSGFAFSSGIGWPARYQNAFFMANFTSRGQAGIDSFTVKPKGAGFEMLDYHTPVSGVLATDVAFGYDGKMYLSDWVEFTWDGGGVGKGKIYTIYDPKIAKNVEVQKITKLFKEGFDQRDEAELSKLLAHADQRVRLRAQFALVKKHATGTLETAAQSGTNLLERLHAIWGLGQLGGSKVLTALLGDAEPEVRAQAAKVLGWNRKSDGAKLLPLLKDAEPRVRYFAIETLGKLGVKAAIPGIWAEVMANDDRDTYLRHACVTALAKLGSTAPVARPETTAAVRLAQVLILRALTQDSIKKFLADPDPRVALEAARAVHDLNMLDALPDLAQLSDSLRSQTVQPDPALWRRVIDAHLRLGKEANAKALLDIARSPKVAETMRKEAIQCLATFAKPGARDRVTGYWNPVAERETPFLTGLVEKNLTNLLDAASSALQLDVIHLVNVLGIKLEDQTIIDWTFDVKKSPVFRATAFRLLAQRKSQHTYSGMMLVWRDASPELKAELYDLFPEVSPSKALNELFPGAMEKGTILERQRVLTTLGRMKEKEALEQLSSHLKTFVDGKLPPELALDVMTAATKTKDPGMLKQLAEYKAKLPKDDPLAAHRPSLVGGDREKGQAIFFSHATAQCMRCHKAQGQGGEAGPNLDPLMAKATREYLLESLLFPDKKISPGFGVETLVLTSGKVINGIVKSQDDKQLTLLDQQNQMHTIPLANIEERSPGKSTMPAMGAILSAEELRDVIEFLSRLK